jgi:hypothetical protein
MTGTLARKWHENLAIFCYEGGFRGMLWNRAVSLILLNLKELFDVQPIPISWHDPCTISSTIRPP